MVGKDVNNAAALLKQGEIIGFPTETVYGLAGNAFSEEAISKIYKVKQRPSYNPLIIHCASIDQIQMVVKSIPEQAEKLLDKFSPGPLTLVLPKQDPVLDSVTAGKKTVAVRIPKHPVALQLLSILDFPLVAPSANPFGYLSPTSAMHVDKTLGNKIPYILDGGFCEIGIESTIISFTEDTPTLLRHGAITKEMITNVIGDINVKTNAISEKPDAPGMLLQHYAPKTPLKIICDVMELADLNLEKAAVIGKDDFIKNVPLGYQVYSLGATDESAAAQLFKTLHEADETDLSCIYIQKFEDAHIGKALNDKLNRAVAK